MDYNQLFEQIKAKKSFLCVGLDSDIAKIPPHLLQLEDPVFEFNKAVIDATAEVAIAYKPNIAFYESRGVEGWKSLEKTIHYIRTSYPDIFTIADAKRGDIGNTSQMYAKAFLETLAFDSITVAPYMGEDSVTPFLQYEGKWVVLLALTSNKGAYDFQFFESEGMKLYEKVLEKSQDWGNARINGVHHHTTIHTRLVNLPNFCHEYQSPFLSICESCGNRTHRTAHANDSNKRAADFSTAHEIIAITASASCTQYIFYRPRPQADHSSGETSWCISRSSQPKESQSHLRSSLQSEMYQLHSRTSERQHYKAAG